jgi:streptogramin lyase
MHTRLATTFAMAVAMPLTSLTAQAVRGGDLIVTNYSAPAAVFRIDSSGTATPLYSGAPLSGPSGITVAANRDVIIADYGTNSLLRIDAQSGALTTIAGNLGGPLRVAEDFDGSFLITSGNSLRRVTPTGTVTTVASAPMVRPFGVAVDLTGDYLVADDFARVIWRITPTGVVAPIFSGPPLQLPQGVAVFSDGDYAVIDGLTDSVFRIDRGTGAISTWVPNATLAANPEGIVPDWLNGFFVAHSQAAGSGILAVDATGGVTSVASGSPFTNLECVARVPTLRGPSTVATGPGGIATFDIDAPAEAGRLYSLILSASVYPGWNVPGDPRTMPINIDAFFSATIGQNGPPVFVGWSTILSASGQATATLDLQFLPPGFFSGLRLYAQGITVTSQATLGTAFNPLRFTFL